MDIIEKFYNDPNTGFLSANKLYAKLKENGHKITMKQVKEFLSNSTTEQVHTRKRAPKEEAKIYGIKGQYQLDLTFLSQYKRQNRGYHIILVAVEINTRYAYAIELKSKTQSSILEALQKLTLQMAKENREPTVFQSDNGKEFKNNAVNRFCDEKNIKQVYCQEGDKKCLALAERFNRTIKSYINKFMTANNTVVWYDKLQDFVYNYNHTLHGTLGMNPVEVNDLQERLIINNALEHNSSLVKKNTIQVGDTVRLPLSKSKFEKEGKNFTNEVFKVNRVMLTNLTVDGKTKKYNINKVLKVSPASIPVESDNIDNAKKESRVNRKVQQEGLDQTNIKPKSKRTAALNSSAVNKILLEK